MVGRVVDPETGLIYLRARYYDPTTGQFLSRDPAVAVTGSAYGYVDGDPLNGSDPSGLCNEATVHCVMGILTGTEELPTGFAEWEKARSGGSVNYVDTRKGN